MHEDVLKAVKELEEMADKHGVNLLLLASKEKNVTLVIRGTDVDIAASLASSANRFPDLKSTLKMADVAGNFFFK